MAVVATAVSAVMAHEEIEKLIPTDGAAGDQFGYAVAIDGGLVLVGAYLDDDLGVDSGSAYVFDSATGQQLHKLVPSDGSQGDLFGCSVSMDGGQALIGARYDDVFSLGSGSAYLFDAGTGQELLKLTPSYGYSIDEFGYSVSLGGGRALVGAPYANKAATDSGAAYVFDATTGQQLHELTPTDGEYSDHFGSAVALDGNLALVGTPDDDDNGYDSGCVYIFDVTTGQQLRKLHPNPAGYSESFGSSVFLEGSLVLIGAKDANWGGGLSSGAAYLFDAATGQQLHRLLPHGGSNNDAFGTSACLDQGRVLVGAPRENDLFNDGGFASIFDAASGQELNLITPYDGSEDDCFGYSVSHEGGLAVVGAPWRDDLGDDSGAAYLIDVIAPGYSYCFGDPGSGTPCPCGNDNDGSLPGSGCSNGVFASGAHLTAVGRASVSNDSVIFTTTHAEPNNAGLYTQANTPLSMGMVWGDGLRCGGYGRVRLQIRFSDATGTSSTTIPIAAKGMVFPR